MTFVLRSLKDVSEGSNSRGSNVTKPFRLSTSDVIEALDILSGKSSSRPELSTSEKLKVNSVAQVTGQSSGCSGSTSLGVQSRTTPRANTLFVLDSASRKKKARGTQCPKRVRCVVTIPPSNGWTHALLHVRSALSHDLRSVSELESLPREGIAGI